MIEKIFKEYKGLYPDDKRPINVGAMGFYQKMIKKKLAKMNSDKSITKEPKLF